MRLYINLINFNSNKLAGVGYFFKRIVSNIDFDNEKWAGFNEIIFLSNNKINCLEVFDIKSSKKIKVIKFPFVHNFIARIFFEQLILPFYLIKGKNVFYSPTPSIPLFTKFLNSRSILISTIHDMIPFRVENKYSFFRSIYVKILSKKAAQISNRVVTVSKFSKKDIAEIANIELSKIDVVYNFVPELSFTSDTISEPYFVTVCTIEPGKNIENMILGFKEFIANNKCYEFYKYKIIGQFGWNYSSLILLLKNLKIEDKVEFTGYLSDSEKNMILRKCTGMIYLSKYEGFGIPPLEAMYFNKISIVSNSSSLPEVVGNAGIIQDPNDINLLASNLKIVVENSDNYKVNINFQLKKFNAEDQILKFTDIIVSSYL